MLARCGQRWILCVVTAALLIGIFASIAVWRAWRPAPWYRDKEITSNATPATSDAMESRIEAFCGNCHALPSPLSFPRDAWHDEALRGYEYYALSGLTHLDPPPAEATVEYFRSRAGEELIFPKAPEATTELSVKFTVEKWAFDPQDPLPPAIAHLRWARLQPDGPPTLLVCNMANGNVMAVDPNDQTIPPKVFASLNNPSHVETCDLDGDNTVDLVVADLGSFVPYDHDMGRVVWLRRDERRNTIEEIVVADGLGRVADVRPGDMDGDGDVDLVVADFGLHRTGQVLLLENTAEAGETPEFVRRQIDPRPGAIHVPIADLDGDGRLDFLAVISQEYECVEAYLNRPNDVSSQSGPTFLRKRLWTGPDLTFGSSGIEPVDLDQDGDLDVLYTNGDAFDNNYANPSHGIQWLENVDQKQFVHHRLTDLVGAFRALAGDIDLDGDLDIIAVVWLPWQVKPVRLQEQPMPTVVCLEQTEPGVFVRHTLEMGDPRYATLELADFDGDGDLDFAVGSHTPGPGSHWLAIWRNELK